MPHCSELTCSQVHMEAFQATQLLTALQLLFHAVLLYITLLSLPGGTAVLQYNHLAKCKTDFFTSQIPTDCCHCSHSYKPCPVLDFPAFVRIQEILIPSLLFSLLPNLLLLPSLSCSTVLSVEGRHPQHPAQGVPTTQGKMPKPGQEVHYQASSLTVAPNTVRKITKNIVVTLSFNRNLSLLIRQNFNEENQLQKHFITHIFKVSGSIWLVILFISECFRIIEDDHYIIYITVGCKAKLVPCTAVEHFLSSFEL